jgi:hypothetical protein
MLVIGQPKFGTVSSKTQTRSWGNSLGEGENVSDSKAEESVNENCEYPFAYSLLIYPTNALHLKHSLVYV